MVAHDVCDVLDSDLARRLDKQRHLSLQVISHGIVEPVGCGGTDLAAFGIEVGESPVAEDVEGAPGAGVAGSRAAEIQRIVGVAEAEARVISFVPALGTGEGDHIGSKDTVVRIVLREGRDAGLVGMGADVPVGYPARNPYDALLLSFAHEVHHPGFLCIGDREGLSFGGVAILVGQGHDDIYGFACRAGPLQSHVDEGTVVHDAVRVDLLLTSAPGGLTDDELVLVHVSDRLVGVCDLLDAPEGFVGVPFDDGEHGSGFPVCGLVEIELTEQHVGVGGVRDHAGAVGAGAAGDDDVGASVRSPLRDQQHGTGQEYERKSSHFAVFY